MTDLNFSLRWGFIGIVLGLLAFSFNYHVTTMSFPGYEIIARPAMFALSFFTEETNFLPKMVIFITGQYIGYFLIIFIIKKLVRYVRS
jgi:hypothetical protein